MIGLVLGALLGHKVGLAYGRRRADEVAWQIAEMLASPPAPVHPHFAVHPDGTVEP